MIELQVDTSDLLKWSRWMNRVPARTPRAIARALNTVGDNVVHNAASLMADETGLDANDIVDRIVVKRATPDDLSWSMDATQVVPKGDWSRPWDQRTGFDDRVLVKIVTMGDELVCQKCLDAADHSPWTMAEVQNMNPYGMGSGSGTNIVHPNCRCAVQAWQATRVLPVTWGAGAPPELFTMKQLGEAVAGEMVTILATDREE